MRFLFLVFAVFMSVPCFGQVKLGPYAGVGVTQWIFDEQKVIENNYRFGIYAGAMADITLNDRFGIQIGLAFNSRGSKTTSSETINYNSTSIGAEVERNFKLNYIVLPVELRIGANAGSTKIYGTAGLYAGYLVSGKYDIVSTSGGSTIQEDTEDLDVGIHDFEYKSLDYGLQIGAGAELESGFFFKAWYFYGLATSDYWKTDFHEMKNTGVEVAVGYFIFGK